VTAANDVWCSDFKGWFRTGDGRRCDPFTLSDAHSRYLLRSQAVARPGLEYDLRLDRGAGMVPVSRYPPIWAAIANARDGLEKSRFVTAINSERSRFVQA
jgi:hypothetical protein